MLLGMLIQGWMSLASDRLVHSDSLVQAIPISGQNFGIWTRHDWATIVSRFTNADLAQVTLTITVAYISFFAGENELKLSGVLATIFAALMVGKYAHPLVCDQAKQFHQVHAIFRIVSGIDTDFSPGTLLDRMDSEQFGICWNSSAIPFYLFFVVCFLIHPPRMFNGLIMAGWPCYMSWQISLVAWWLEYCGLWWTALVALMWRHSLALMYWSVLCMCFFCKLAVKGSRVPFARRRTTWRECLVRNSELLKLGTLKILKRCPVIANIIP